MVIVNKGIKLVMASFIVVKPHKVELVKGVLTSHQIWGLRMTYHISMFVHCQTNNDIILGKEKTCNQTKY